VNRIRYYSELNSMVTASTDKTIRFTDVEVHFLCVFIFFSLLRYNAFYVLFLLFVFFILFQKKRGKLMRVLEGHTRAVMTFDYSAQHNILASGGAERDILLWYVLERRERERKRERKREREREREERERERERERRERKKEEEKRNIIPM
jgi:WD40 repeat protein